MDNVVHNLYKQTNDDQQRVSAKNDSPSGSAPILAETVGQNLVGQQATKPVTQADTEANPAIRPNWLFSRCDSVFVHDCSSFFVDKHFRHGSRRRAKRATTNRRQTVHHRCCEDGWSSKDDTPTWHNNDARDDRQRSESHYQSTLSCPLDGTCIYNFVNSFSYSINEQWKTEFTSSVFFIDWWRERGKNQLLSN